MNFLININKQNPKQVSEKTGTLKSLDTDDSFFYVTDKTLRYNEFKSQNEKNILLGDIIARTTDESIKMQLGRNNISDFGGFYYLVNFNYDNNIIKIFSSIFNILPLYYYEDNEHLIVSSRVDYIKKLRPQLNISKNFLLERLLFNYPLFNETIYNEIKLVPSNHHVELTDEINIKKHFDITDYYVDVPKSGKRVLEDISENFIISAADYFPDEEAAVSFTSGFDGRTLVAAAKKLKKKFFTYSFGTEDSIDIFLPKEQAENIDIEFVPYLLNKEYIKSYSLQCGLDLIDKTEGNATFARAHYRFASELLSKRVNYILTGNFGSELFRAFHNPGVVVSKEMFSFFSSEDDKWIDEIRNSEKIKFLKHENFNMEIEYLFDELRTYKEANKGLSKNSFFYKFIFEEVFRKYFGPEIVMQSHFLLHRAPYLDPSFVKYLLTTKYSGVYSDFATDNPLKRFKGQLPYSYIIRSTFPELLNFKTGKGYKPADLLSTKGKLSIALSKIRKKSLKDNDPYSVTASFNNNLKFFSSLEINSDLFNSDIIRRYFSGDYKGEPNNIIQMLSLNYYLNKILI